MFHDSFESLQSGLRRRVEGLNYERVNFASIRLSVILLADNFILERAIVFVLDALFY